MIINNVIGPFIDRIEYTPDMAWISNEKRIRDLEEKEPPTPTPSDIGAGLKVVGNTLMVDVASTATSGNKLPASSASLMKEFDKAELILDRI